MLVPGKALVSFHTPALFYRCGETEAQGVKWSAQGHKSGV